MAHTQDEIVQSRIALSEAIHREIQIHQHYIAALRNALSGMKLVAAIEMPVPIEQGILADTPDTVAEKAKRAGFVKSLADRVANAAGSNGQ